MGWYSGTKLKPSQYLAGYGIPRAGYGGARIGITSGADSGTGSLRWAEAQPGPKVILPTTVNTVTLLDRIVFQPSRGDFYLAGHAAPGGCLQVRGPGDWVNGLLLFKTSEFFARGIRGHQTSSPAAPGGGGQFCANLQDGCRDFAVDHCSMYWNKDDNGCRKNDSNLPDLANGTIQNCLFGEALDGTPNGHSTLVNLTGAHDYAVTPPIEDYKKLYNISFHHNVCADSGSRFPSVRSGAFGMGGVEVVNNIGFNWNEFLGRIWDATYVDLVNNYLIGGPLTPYPANVWQVIKDPLAGNPSIYASGNILELVFTNPLADNFGPDAVTGHYLILENGQPAPMAYRRSVRLPQPLSPVPVEAGDQNMVTTLLGHVGASVRIQEGGGFLIARDAVDVAQVNRVATRNGLPALRTTWGPMPPGLVGSPVVRSAGFCDDVFKSRLGYGPLDDIDWMLLTVGGEQVPALWLYLDGWTP